MSTLLYNTYIVKWSTKGEGVEKVQKKMSTWFMNDPLIQNKSKLNIYTATPTTFRPLR